MTGWGINQGLSTLASVHLLGRGQLNSALTGVAKLYGSPTYRALWLCHDNCPHALPLPTAAVLTMDYPSKA